MMRAFKLLEQHANLIQRQARAQAAKIMRFNQKCIDLGYCAPLRQAGTQKFVHDSLEGARTASRLGLQPFGNVVVQCQGSSHITMLSNKHHDV
jgi:hypothetical protein